MCNLCSTNPATVADEKQRLRIFASRLHKAKLDLEGMANGYGEMRPHSDAAHELGARLARLGIDLIKEWA